MLSRINPGDKIKVGLIQYQILNFLGEGGAAQVFKALNLIDKSECAIKILEIPINNTTYKNYIYSQLALHRSFNHKNIIKYYDHDILENKLMFLVMQIGQKSLKQYCDSFGGTLPEKKTIQILLNILSGLSILQYKKIIHRDLKLENIIYREGKFKIIDFGISTNKLANTMIGTPLFIAPQILKNQSYDVKVDVWCLAIIVFQIYFGEIPFYDISFTPKKLLQIIKKICQPELDLDLVQLNYKLKGISEQRINKFNQIKKKTSSDFLDLLKKMIVQDPKKRLDIVQIFEHSIIEKLCPGTYNMMKKQFEVLKLMLMHRGFIQKTIEQLNKTQFKLIQQALTHKCINSLKFAQTYFIQIKYKPKKQIFNFQISEDQQKKINQPWKEIRPIIKTPLIQAYKKLKGVQFPNKYGLMFRLLVCIQSHHIFSTLNSYNEHFRQYFSVNFDKYSLQNYIERFYNGKQDEKLLIKMMNMILQKYFSFSHNSRLQSNSSI